MGARLKDEAVLKTPFLAALDAVGNSASKEQLLLIRKALVAKVPLIDLFGQLSTGEQVVREAEIDHVARDWFHEKTGWWPEWVPEKAMREGLIRSIDLAIKYGEKGETGRPLPVDYWWVRDTGAFRFVSVISKQQQTVLLLTPSAPGRARPRARTKKSARPRARTKKSARPRARTKKSARPGAPRAKKSARARTTAR